MMNIPELIADLVKAQNSHDASAYAACFSATAVVEDEGQTYKGRAEIRKWIEEANAQNQTAMKPLEFEEKAPGLLLTAEISGTFTGSPVILQFHFVVENGLIQYLKIT